MTTEAAESESSPKPKRAPALVRDLGVLDASMIVMGAMIGSGVFITSAESARYVGSPGWLLLAWLLAGVVTVAGAMSTCELAAMMPKAGGQYVFLRTAYGPLVGFLFGWSLFLVVQTGTIAAVAVAFAKFLGVFVPAVSPDNALPAIHLGSHYAIRITTQQVVAVALIALLTYANTRGLKIGARIQNGFTFVKTAALIGLIVVGLALGLNKGAAAWTNVTFLGGEVKDPGKTLPRALFGGTTVVIGLYLLANLTYVMTLPFDGIAHAPQQRVGTAALEAALGPVGLYVMAGAILISTFGCVNGLVLAGARVYYAMARDKLFFQAVARTNENHVPAAALYAQGIWASLLTLPATVTTGLDGKAAYGNLYGELLEYVIPADLLFCMLMVGSLFLLRAKAPFLNRPYKTLAYPVPPVIYVVLGTLLVLDFLYLKPQTSGAGFLLVLAGLPVYWLWNRASAPATKPLEPKLEPTSE